MEFYDLMIACIFVLVAVVIFIIQLREGHFDDFPNLNWGEVGLVMTSIILFIFGISLVFNAF